VIPTDYQEKDCEKYKRNAFFVLMFKVTRSTFLASSHGLVVKAEDS
jgi:hypothetical protein